MEIKVFALNDTKECHTTVMINEETDGHPTTVQDLLNHKSMLDWFAVSSGDALVSVLNSVKFPGDDDEIVIESRAVLKMTLKQELQDGTEVHIGMNVDSESSEDDDNGEETEESAEEDGDDTEERVADGEIGHVTVEMFGGLIEDLDIEITSGVTKLGDEEIINELRAYTKFSKDQIAHSVITVNGTVVEPADRAKYVLYDKDSISLSSRKASTKGC